MNWTRFPNQSAFNKKELQHDWTELLEHIRHAGPYRSKADCPWIKLAQFGDNKTAKGSLRHDGNVLAVWGVEGDYDGEQVSPEDAIAALEAAQIRAAIYTSPSHTDEAPRWRVIAPLSRPHDPAQRSQLLARINGVLHGILASESFTLSQSYYYGRVQGSDYRLLVTFDDPEEGECLDALDSLDEIAILPPKSRTAPGGSEFSDIAGAVASLGRKLKTGDGRRQLLKTYIGKRLNMGLTGDEVRTLLDDAILRFFDPADPVDWSDINGLIRDFEAADAAHAEMVDSVVGEFVKTLAKPIQKPTHSGIAPMDWDALADQEAEPEEFALAGWLPMRTTTLLSANGGGGKSNLSLQLAVSLATGNPFLDMPVQPRRVLVISAEDDRRTVHYRISNICAHMRVGMADLENLIIYDMTEVDCTLWRQGSPTKQMQWLADTVDAHQAEVVILDNASDVFCSNENDRSEVRGFVRCLNMIARANEAAVLLLAHVDKASVRTGAGSETNSTFSGSTAWNNSCRSRWAMQRDGVDIVLRHEKSNFGAMQDEIRLQFDATAKVIRIAGSSPVDKVANELAKNTKRAALLRLILNAENAGQNLSMSANANNNAFNILKAAEGFPKLERSDFFSTLYQLQRDGLLQEVEYTHDRKKRTKIQLTETGRLRAVQGSGAPAMWKGGDHVEG